MQLSDDEKTARAVGLQVAVASLPMNDFVNTSARTLDAQEHYLKNRAERFANYILNGAEDAEG